MSLIEGIGDEVTIVMSILTLVITMAVAWISTLVLDRPPTSLTFTRNEYLDQDLIQEDELPEEVYNNRNIIGIIAADASQEIENIAPGVDETTPADNITPGGDETTSADLNAEGLYGSSRPSTSDYDTGENVERNDIEINSQNIETSETSRTKDSTDKDGSNKSEDSNEVDIVDAASNIPSQNIGGQSSSEQISSTTLEPNASTINTTLEMIRIRLKFLNESERTVDVNPNVTLLQFKRDAFVEEISQGFTLRLILNGHILQDDQRTLAQLNVNNNCVIHCQLLETRTIPNTAPNVNNSELDIGQIMIPMFAVLLGLVWYVRLEYRHLFTATSTLSLLGVSVLFFLAVLASWRT